MKTRSQKNQGFWRAAKRAKPVSINSLAFWRWPRIAKSRAVKPNWFLIVKSAPA
jgi:hypothetical protein